ncbi:hypothetical protein RB620_24565 [Paenibacillus sp. LHD-117]|uniref:hypothetical protein n=1 Tax=Paenibacillus sp. LHD-117 TaxID=3071412 RepID=UPI0027E150C1|nr:hypothetical protein [Paenibacillus sp. LHD-117]MDQ6422610.1 hypothetical protein [Paenibacillus sp. LHD-117]
MRGGCGQQSRSSCVPAADPGEQLIDVAAADSCSPRAASATFLVRGQAWPSIAEQPPTVGRRIRKSS